MQPYSVHSHDYYEVFTPLTAAMTLAGIDREVKAFVQVSSAAVSVIDGNTKAWHERFMQRSTNWQCAEQFISMLTVDLRLGILAEQILTQVVFKLISELEQGGVASGRIVRLTQRELCGVAGKTSPFPQRQLHASL